MHDRITSPQVPRLSRKLDIVRHRKMAPLMACDDAFFAGGDIAGRAETLRDFGATPVSSSSPLSSLVVIQTRLHCLRFDIRETAFACEETGVGEPGAAARLGVSEFSGWTAIAGK